MAMIRVHVALGPVQRFIGQARRTRDWWTGSFLLSYLVGQAMASILEHEGRIIFPQVDPAGNNLLQVILRRNQGHLVPQGPTVGSLPNRFQADVPDVAVIHSAVDRIHHAWHQIHEQVWNRFVSPIASLGHATDIIWKRQVHHFWDITWVASSVPYALDLRKNWRTPPVAEEPGDKCTVMGTWQELSGYIRVYQRSQQDAFWVALRDQVRGTALRADERLSAIALIKRLLPLVSVDAIGWELPLHYPSTVFVAAIPWIKSVVESHPHWAEQFAFRAGTLDGQLTDSGLLNEYLKRQAPHLRILDKISGNACFPSVLDNDNLWPSNKNVRQLRQEVRALFRHHGLSTPRPFYGVLLMDGDRLGKSLQSNQATAISGGLGDFIAQVPFLVRQANGATIYAGGDDVFALVPWDQALHLATQLRQAYLRALSPVNPDLTVSTAIVYAHIHAPLGAVVEEAHRLLDVVAKEETGRNSLAVTVWKTHGPVLTWASPWPSIDETRIARLVQSLQSLETSHTLLYKLRRYFQPLGESTTISESLLQALLQAEYRKTQSRPSEDFPVLDWIALAKKLRFRQHGTSTPVIESQGWSLDGLLWIRFLAGEGDDDDHDE